MISRFRSSVEVIAETFGRKLVAERSTTSMFQILFHSQRTFAFDSCLAGEHRLLFVKHRLLLQEFIQNITEIFLVAAFVDKNGLANVL